MISAFLFVFLILQGQIDKKENDNAIMRRIYCKICPFSQTGKPGCATSLLTLQVIGLNPSHSLLILLHQPKCHEASCYTRHARKFQAYNRFLLSYLYSDFSAYFTLIKRKTIHGCLLRQFYNFVQNRLRRMLETQHLSASSRRRNHILYHPRFKGSLLKRSLTISLSAGIRT